jgi:hypothetical protein
MAGLLNVTGMREEIAALEGRLGVSLAMKARGSATAMRSRRC